MCVTILPFKRIISLLVTILICRKEEIYSHVIHMYYTLSSITFPQNACIHSVLVISIFIFEQKILLYLWQVKYTLFSVRADAFHLWKLVSRNSTPVYLKPIIRLLMYSASYLKILYFLPKVNLVTIFFVLNLCPSNRKTLAFSGLQLYIAKLIAGLTVINI